MLRNEPGIYYEDLYPLIAFLPRYAYASDGTDVSDLLPLWQTSYDEKVAPLKRVETRTSSLTISMDDIDRRTWSKSYRPRRYTDFDPEKVLPVVYTDHPLRPSRLPPRMGFFDYFPILRPIKRIPKMFKPKQVEVHEEVGFIRSQSFHGARYTRYKSKEPVDSNVPLQILLHISSYNSFLLKNDLLVSSAASMMTNSISALQDTILGLDRIKTTPLPFAYQAHLRMTLWYEAFVFLWVHMFNSPTVGCISSSFPCVSDR